MFILTNQNEKLVQIAKYMLLAGMGKKNKVNILKDRRCSSSIFNHLSCPDLCQVGEALPAVEVQEGEPGNKVSMDQLFKGKKGVLFAVPGAFTPGCSKVRPPAVDSTYRLLHTLTFSSATLILSLLLADSPSRLCAASPGVEE